MLWIVVEEFKEEVIEEALPVKQSIYARYVKRVLDFTLSLIALLLFWWVLVIVAILVRVKLGSPVIFKQPRPGKDEKIFMLYKFRSMTDERDENGELLPDEVRLTSFGKRLRSTSLDELPELFNILKGDMAIVGPRPLAVVYLPFYNAFEKRRHCVRPGLTGLAQVHGRNAASWEGRFSYDVSYTEKVSLRLDFNIIVQTVAVVFARKDIAQGEECPESFHVVRQKQLAEKQDKLNTE